MAYIDYDRVAQALYVELMKALAATRVPKETQLAAIDMCRSEIEDYVFQESFTWSEKPVPWHPGHRARER